MSKSNSHGSSSSLSSVVVLPSSLAPPPSPPPHRQRRKVGREVRIVLPLRVRGFDSLGPRPFSSDPGYPGEEKGLVPCLRH